MAVLEELKCDLFSGFCITTASNILETIVQGVVTGIRGEVTASLTIPLRR